MARSPPRRRYTGYPRDHRDNRGDSRRSSSRDRRYGDRYREREHFESRRDRDRDRDRDFHDGRRDDRYSTRYDDHRPPRRDRSRERKRSRERGASPVRDARHHSRDGRRREQDSHDDRDRKRRKGDPSLNRSASPRPSAADLEAAAAEEAKKAKTRAKVEAWKKARMQPQNITDTNNAPYPNTPAAASPTVESPTVSLPATAGGSPAPIPDRLLPDNLPRPKFDHKEIRRRATEKPQQTRKAALGDDALLPAQTNEKTDYRNATGSQQATHAQAQGESKIERGNSKISGFGLNTSGSDRTTDRIVTESARALDDDDDKVKREFKKLPDLPRITESTDQQQVFGSGGQGDDDSADDLLSDDEEAEAALKAIQKRAEQAEIGETDMSMMDVGAVNTHVNQSTMPGDVDAKNPDSNNNNDDDEEEEVDPLDAFMNDLHQGTSLPGTKVKSGVRHSRGAQILAQDEGGAGDEATASDDPKDLLNNHKRAKKEVPIVDHSKMQYEEFRKNFYTESPELASMTEDEVEALRAELDNIKIDDHSKNVPTPISKWAQGGFGTQILEVLRVERLDAPTSIQSQALPAIMSGRDFIGIAKTGSGKTLAFILPMFRHIQDQPRATHMDGPIGLILAPTRELAVQIFRMCKPYLKALNLRGVCAYGGAPIKDQIADLKRGAEVIVCTPGRMIDLLAANSGRVTNLRRVTYCVLDEADRMFDMGFEPQITRILTNIRPDRQVVLFSATFPAKMEVMAKKATRNRILITVGGRSVVAPEITQIVEVLPEAAKFRRVLDLLGRYLYEDDGRRVVIFVERQETADTVFVNLGQHQYPSVPVHGGREQIDRDQAISDFKAGHYPILVATSVAARGLDVKQLDLVIQYDCPNHAEDYVHRAGRTGRAGNKGTAITFITPEQERYAPFIVRALEESDQEVPEDLQTMASAFKQKLKAGEVQKTGSGFGGKGIERLEAARVAERNRERKQFKTGDDPDSDEETENKPEVKIAEKIAKATGVIRERDAQPASTTLSAELTDKIRNAMNVTKRETPPESADPMARVQAAAAGISSRLTSRGTARPGAPGENRGPDAGAYHTTLEINDFPQKARWAVTNRANVSKILDATGTSITTKGIYYPKGQHPGPGDEPELFILIEGDTELVVQKAVKLLSEHLEKGTDQAHELEARQARTGGRYNVPVS